MNEALDSHTKKLFALSERLIERSRALREEGIVWTELNRALWERNENVLRACEVTRSLPLAPSQAA